MSAQTVEFGQYIQAIKGRLWLVAIFVVVALGAAYWRAGRAPASYTATATMLVTAPVVTPVPPVAGGDATSFNPGSGTVTADILALLPSRPIAERVARRLELSSPSEVQRALSATPARGTSLVRISATARNPELAADIANVTAEEFVAFFRETNRASVSEARRFVEEQLKMASARLAASERAIQAFKESRQIVSVATATAQIQAAVSTSQAELDAAILALRENDVRLAATRARLQREQPIIVASRSTSDNPVFRRYQDRLIELEVQRVTLGQTYTPQHPRMEQINRESADLRSRLTAETRTAIAEEITVNNPIHARLLDQIVNHEVERTALAARVEAFQVTLRRRAAAALTIPAAETEFNRLVRENHILESNYTTLSSRYQEILLRENLAANFPAALRVVEPAAASSRPAPSSLPRTAAAAGLAGLVLGIAAAFFLESLDDRIRTPEDAERALGVPVLAQIPAQGGLKPSPVPAVFVLVLVIAVMLALAAAVTRFHGATSAIRTAAVTTVAWLGNPQPVLGAIGLAGDDR